MSEYYRIQLDKDRHSRIFRVTPNVYNVTFRPITTGPGSRLSFENIPIQDEHTAIATKVHLQRMGERKMFERFIR